MQSVLYRIPTLVEMPHATVSRVKLLDNPLYSSHSFPTEANLQNLLKYSCSFCTSFCTRWKPYRFSIHSSLDVTTTVLGHFLSLHPYNHLQITSYIRYTHKILQKRSVKEKLLLITLNPKLPQIDAHCRNPTGTHHIQIGPFPSQDYVLF